MDGRRRVGQGVDGFSMRSSVRRAKISSIPRRRPQNSPPVKQPTEPSKIVKKFRQFNRKHRALLRFGSGAMAALMLIFVIGQAMNSKQQQDRYDISSVDGSILSEPVPLMSSFLKFNEQSREYIFNEGFQPGSGTSGDIGSPNITAKFASGDKKTVTVTDPVNSVDISLTPKFLVDEPRQNQNRVIYPLLGRNGVKVYTAQGTGVKEDIILYKYAGDKMSFAYDLGLAEGTEARMESDGSLSVYGAESTLLGDVSTGSEADAELLKNARANAEKTQLLFRVPAPFVLEKGKKSSQSAKAWFELKGQELKINVAGLRGASYPLSIDPSIYVETAARLMRGNNESNIDFDVANELIQKGKTTGGRFDAWTSTLSLPNARWAHATAVAGGYIYVVGGNSGSTRVGDVYWAKFNPTTGAIEATNPGAGTCANWCTNSAYNLPSSQVRDGASLVAYNGYLYLIGGRDSGGTRTNTVYIAKLGVNGEPSLWHPTDSNKDNWVYWYSDTALSTERAFSSAVAYNNRLYLLGGQTTAATGGVQTVEYAEMSPTGTLSAWSSTGMQSLPSTNRFGHTVQMYNDRMYVIGGANGTTLTNTVHYIKMATDGTMQGSWTQTTSFGTARMSWGGTFSVLWGGYIYISGGCTALNGSGYCTTIAGDTQLASINADGSLTDWSSITATSSRIGYGLVVWRNVIYGIGGCTVHNTTNGNCTTTATATQYGPILQDGEASTVSTSVSSGTSPCISTTWTNCDLAPEGDGNGESGRMSGATIINNGFIYYMGGCTAVNSGSVCYTGNAGKSSDNISYASIAADGSIVRIPSCAGSFVGSWCVINTGMGAKLSAFGYAVFNNVVYIIGGTTGVQWEDEVWRSTFNNDGSWGAWTSQTFANLALGNAKGYQYVFTRANPSSAGTYPGNLYVLGGCSGVTASDNGLDCSGAMYSEVYKCNITTTGALEEGDANDCDTANQLQIDAEPGTGGTQGLGVMAGTVYANYVYLIGGQSPNESERGQVMYAKIDNSNNIVAVSGSTWITSGNSISPVRRRGVAFGYNGYLYALAGYNVGVGGSLNDLLFAKIDVSDGSIGAFNTSTVTVSARWDLRAVVNNGYVYAIGGCSTGAPPASCTVMTGTVQTFQLYNNYSGSPASYGAGANLFNTDRIGASATVLNGYIYVAGGCISATDCTNATNDVQYASLSSVGALGTWASASNVLPADRAWGQLETAGGSLYYIGGQDDTATNEQSTVYYASTFSSGNITAAWSTASGALGDVSTVGVQTAPRTKFGAATWNNRIYVVGGLDGSAASTNTVFISPQLNSGGNIAADSWVSDADTVNVARNGNTVVAYANNLYAFGGHDGTNYLNDSQYTQINSDGTVDAWSYTTSLPSRLRNADGFASNGFMYLFGGRSADTTCVSNTIVAPISANTTIATGNNPTGLGEWFETNVKYSGDRYGNAAVYNEGKVYILGGGCGATVTYTGANRVIQSTLQSQPQIARYSRLIDTDSNVFPNSWLLNGVDNDIGARWQGSYKSAIDASNVTLQQSFDDGSNGNNVTTGNSEYNNCYTNGSMTNQYTNSQYVTPSLSMRQQVTSGSGNAGCSDYFNDTTVRYDRFYVRFDTFAGLSGTTAFYTIGNQADTNDPIAQIRVTNGGLLNVRDKFTTEATSAALAANTWHRLEVALVGGQLRVRTFEGANLHGTTPSQSMTINLGNSAFTDADSVSIGLLETINATYAAYFDEHVASSSNWVGPAQRSWGQVTSQGDIILGDVMSYIPKDSSGTDTEFARWYFVFVTIDASQTYGYPEDVTRGPTIADLSLFFTSDPSKRLRHGKTFTGGEQQPLDTPCRQSVDANCPLP